MSTPALKGLISFEFPGTRLDGMENVEIFTINENVLIGGGLMSVFFVRVFFIQYMVRKVSFTSVTSNKVQFFCNN